MLYDDTVTVGPPQVERDEHPFAGFVDFRGLPIDVENLRGSLREGVDRDGHAWTTVMLHHYGEVRGTLGVDDDPVDVYIGPDAQSDLVVVVHQNRPDTGKYDEDKCMLGFRTVEDALEAYRAQYDRPGFYGGHDVFDFGEFALWCVARGAGGVRKGYVVTFAKGTSGGPYVGPHGGLWADPQHKVHWTPTAHGVQADWVGSEDDAKQAERAKRVERAVGAWVAAADHYKEHRTDQRAYQRAYNALDELGRALNLDVGKGEDFALAALKWLKAHGHKASLTAPRKSAAKRGEQGDLFKALTQAGFGEAYVRRLAGILGAPEYVLETPEPNLDGVLR